MEGFRKERRWVVLVTDGRFILLGRDTDPSEQQVEDLKASLCERGLSGFLVIMEGDPAGGSPPRLMEVRPMAEPETSFEEAAAAAVRNFRAGLPGLLH